MKNASKILMCFIVAVLSSFGLARADLITQSQDFAFSTSQTFEPGDNNILSVVGPNFFTATFAPFNTSLGTLNAATVELTNFSSTASATVPDDAVSGTLSGSHGGAVMLTAIHLLGSDKEPAASMVARVRR